MFSIWMWCVCVEIIGLVPMANKRASPKEVGRNVLRRAKPSIDPSDGANEVNKDELEEEFRKEKNLKYKQASRAQITTTNQKVKELLELSNSRSIGPSTSSGVGYNTTYTPKGVIHSITMLARNVVLHLIRDLSHYESRVQQKVIE